MMDDRAGYGRGDWREWTPPPPFVTHKEWGEVKEELGSLKQSTTHIMQTYGHIRGEMHEGFLRLERAMLARQNQQDAANATASNGVSLSVRELVLLIAAIAAAAVILTYLFVTGNPNVAKDLAG